MSTSERKFWLQQTSGGGTPTGDRGRFVNETFYETSPAGEGGGTKIFEVKQEVEGPRIVVRLAEDRPGQPAKGPVYISGPMTGIENFNYKLFNEIAENWRKAGWDVCNPAENDANAEGWDRSECLRADIADLLWCQSIALLPGWQKSAGAKLEVAIARELGMSVYDAFTMEPYEETILDEAKRLVYGDRRADYDHPYYNWSGTAKIWSVILGHEISAEQAALCMIGTKLARLRHKIKRDSLVDVAGYAEVTSMINAFKKDKE